MLGTSFKHLYLHVKAVYTKNELLEYIFILAEVIIHAVMPSGIRMMQLDL